MSVMNVAFGCDHAGFGLKAAIFEHLGQRGVQFVDFGCPSSDMVDYPHYAALVARAVAAGSNERGILVCGSGLGVSIAANRFKGVRAINGCDETLVRLARQHNDANVLCLGAQMLGWWKARACIDVFLDTAFDGGRHIPRIRQLDELSSTPVSEGQKPA